MAPSKVLFFSAASLLLLNSTAAAQDSSREVLYRMLKILFNSNICCCGAEGETSCITNMNTTRQAAGLGELQSTTDFVTQDPKAKAAPDGIWVDVCNTLLDGKDFTPSADKISKGTYALFGLGEVDKEKQELTDLTNLDGLTPQCDAAVKKWQEGFSSFEAKPPVDRAVQYTEATPEQVSFVTLYNPGSQPKGQCALAACKGKPQTTPPPGDDETKTVAGLVCFTEPNVFGNNPLFTQDQWNNIKKVLSSSASTAVPSLMAVAALMFAAFLP
ncbi:hypothetical protein Emed_002176 [Eimeria media]